MDRERRSISVWAFNTMWIKVEVDVALGIEKLPQTSVSASHSADVSTAFTESIMMCRCGLLAGARCFNSMQ